MNSPQQSQSTVISKLENSKEVSKSTNFVPRKPDKKVAPGKALSNMQNTQIFIIIAYSFYTLFDIWKAPLIKLMKRKFKRS